MMSSSMTSGSGSQGFHQMVNSLNPPPRSLGYGPSGPVSGPGSGPGSVLADASKLHNPYASNYANPAGIGIGSQQAQLRDPQYSLHDVRYQHNLSGHSTSLPGGPPQVSISQHPAGIGVSSMDSMSLSSGYHSRNLMSQYSDQRFPPPDLSPRQATPVHSLGPTYSGLGYSYSHSTTGNDLWRTPAMNHLQQRPYGYHSDPRAVQASFGQNSSDYNSLHQQQQSAVQQRPFYQSSTSQSSDNSSLSNRIPSDCSTIPSYSNQGPYPPNSAIVSQVSSRGPHPSSLRQSQFSMSYSNSNSSLQSSTPPPPPPPPLNVSHSSISSNNPGIRYSHTQYSYNSGPMYGDSSNYHSHYGGPNSSLSSLPSSRRPSSPSANCGLNSQETFLNSGSNHLKTSTNQNLSSTDASNNGSSSSITSHAQTSNSLNHLEQMVMPHAGNSGPTNKSLSASSSNSYYHSVSVNSLQNSQNSTPSSQPYSLYSNTSSPHSASSNYYQQQYPQSSSSLWSSQPNQPLSTSSGTNTHSTLTSSSVSYSSTSEKVSFFIIS